MSVTIQTKIIESINYAAVHLKQQILVGDIKMENLDVDKVVCRITAVPEFIYEYKKEVPVQGKSAAISTPELKINDGLYRQELIEAQEGEIKIELFHPDEPERILGFLNQTVHLQPYLHWDGYRFAHTMPGFMQPNDPLVGKVLKRAGELAAKEGRSIHGYQGRSKEDVKKQAGDIYQALKDMQIHYLSSPASFEETGQKIRIPHQVLHEDAKQGTCLDLAVLYATCLEAASLNAVIFVIPGHAFSGVWLSDKSFSNAKVTPGEVDPQVWATAMEEILPVECTTYTAGSNSSFEYALSSAKESVKQWRYMIDVMGARNQEIVPVYTYTDKPICGSNVADFAKVEYSNEKKSRLELFRDQAMDITTKSKLLNDEAVSLELEFSIKSAEMLKHGADPVVLTNLLDSKVSEKKKNQEIIRSLYSKSRQNLRETGKTNLFFAINELKWCQEQTKKDYYAVMYLCPAEIRRNTRGDFRLHVNFEEMFFNPALKVMLEHVYHLDSSKLANYPGDNYAAQMDFLNFLIEKQSGWKIVENNARLALYSIPNESIWKGLNDPNVLSHEIVNGILECRMSWTNELKGNKKQADALYAFEADSSQAEIIEAAFERKSQVVVGPAGNGKTQTVVNIMMEAIKRGEKVLFVSEKAPALEVANEKLNQALAGVFNLMIINGKHRTSDVTAQIKKTLEYMEVPRDLANTNVIDQSRKKYSDYSQYIEKYYDLMKAERACGKTLEELIEMYAKYSKCSLNLELDEAIGQIPLEEAEDQMRIFAAVMEECDRSKGDFAEFVRYDNLKGSEEKETLRLAKDALEKFEKVRAAAENFEKEFADYEVSKENEKAFLLEMLGAASLLSRCPVHNKKVEMMLEKDDSGDASYKQDILKKMTAFSKLKPKALLYKKKKEELYEMLVKVYSPAKVRNLLDDPVSALELLEGEEIISNSQGDVSVGNSASDVEQLKAFLAKRDAALVNKSKEFSQAVIHATELIVEGKGWNTQRKAEELVNVYLQYEEAMKAASEKIIRNEADFKEKHPALMKNILFEEWIENRHVDTNRNRSFYDEIVNGMEKEGYGGLIKQIEAAREKTVINEDDVIEGYYKAWAGYQIEKIQSEVQTVSNFNYIIFQNRVEQLTKEEKKIHDGLKNEILQAHLERMPNIQEGISNNVEFGVLQALVRNKKTTIRGYFEQAPQMLQTICPCMIMDPASVAEYIPSDFPKFDLVVIDEGSQMPTYNALIPISKANRCMIFGDEKQLQPRDEFKKQIEEEFGLVVGTESILTAAYITSMPRKMLRFHYRSENEGLIAFSNHHYYNGDIITFPTCDTADSGVAYEFVEDGLYDRDGSKGNEKEAVAVIEKIRTIYDELPENTECTVGIITLNVHQRDLVQKMLRKEIGIDSKLGMKTDDLVDVVNLEACQGKEWDYVIISPGFAYDKNNKFNMNFGALNREHGSNRLNVMLTRARKKMFVITSIEPYMISDTKEQGTRDFKEFLLYAKGEKPLDRRVRNGENRRMGLVNTIATELEEKGYEVHTNIGSSEFKVDLGIVSKNNPEKYVLGILLDHFHEQRSSIHDREVIYQKSLEYKGWKIYRLRKLNWYNDSQREIRQILKSIEKSEKEVSDEV